jgi:hypothetical protein
MPVHGLLAAVLAQTCVALLPPPQAEIEWFRDGRPYARDVPLRATRTERVYRRRHESGPAAQRVVSCTTADGVSYFTDRIGSATAVRIPVALPPGRSRVVGRTTVRRIEPPAGGSSRVLWFSVSNPGISVYGLQQRAGVVEVRVPSPSGGFSVLRAVTRGPVPAAASAQSDSQARLLAQRNAELERTISVLTDSIQRLLARPAAAPAPPVPYSSPDVAEFTAVDVYVERAEYDEALALLMRVRARLLAWSDSMGTRHRALDPLHDRLLDVLRRCVSARQARPARGRVPACAI